MRVLITGLTGFIGARVARALVAAGDEVHGIARPGSDLARLGDCAGKIHWIRHDLADSVAIDTAIAAVRPECAIHMAWYVVPNKVWNAPENRDCVAQSLALAQSLVRAGCRRMLSAGTLSEYDWSFALHHETETPCKPHTLYGAAKRALFLQLERYLGTTTMTLVWPRYNFAYGPGEAPARLVPSVILKLLADEAVPLTAGTQIRDFLYVDDIADATVALAKSTLTGAINVGSGEGTAVRDIALAAATAFGRPDLLPLLQFGALPIRPGDTPRLVPDTSRLTRELGWRPSVSLAEGMRRTVESFRQAQAEAAAKPRI